MSPPPESSDLIRQLASMIEAEIDALDYGVIGFDADGAVVVYNAFESAAAGLSRDRVIGKNLFTDVAPCTNNYLIAHRYQTEPDLDEELDYVFTLRMRPTPVRLRLLAKSGTTLRYMIVNRRAADDRSDGS